MLNTKGHKKNTRHFPYCQPTGPYLYGALSLRGSETRYFTICRKIRFVVRIQYKGNHLVRRCVGDAFSDVKYTQESLLLLIILSPYITI